MSVTKQMAKHFREVHFGGNWTWSNLKDNLADVRWEETTQQVHGFNTIATLLFHMNYFTDVVLRVLEGGPLDGDDKLSFDHPPIHSEDDWKKMLDKTWTNAEKLAQLLEQLPDERLWENIGPEKYGNYYRNIHGVIEHTHYHLGQLVLVKKLVREANAAKA